MRRIFFFFIKIINEKHFSSYFTRTFLSYINFKNVIIEKKILELKCETFGEIMLAIHVTMTYFIMTS